MQKTEITYSESIETYQDNGLKRWRRSEISASLSPTDNPLNN